MLAFVSGCDDPGKLKTLIENARKHGALEVEAAAFRKLISLVPAETPGTVEYDFWRIIQAFEFVLSDERGRTTRLGRTRQKVARVGVAQTLRDWALDDGETDGFKMLLDRGMPELTGEAVVLRHADQFEPDVVSAARGRLERAGVDTAKLAPL